jgi:hypothetical protein
MFDWNLAQQSEALAWLMFFLLLMAAGAIGCAIHGLHREYRTYVEYRKVHERWKQIVEEVTK